MAWVQLLAVVHDLQRVGMGVAMAVEAHALSEVGPSQALAQRWLTQRHRLGDAAEAMRALSPEVRDQHDRFVLEALVLCLERPNADQHQVLAAALDHVRGRRRTLPLALVLLALSSGEEPRSATRRAEAAFGSHRIGGLRDVLERSADGPIPRVLVVESALREAHLRRRGPRWSAYRRLDPRGRTGLRL